jgi:hypothetical protein
VISFRSDLQSVGDDLLARRLELLTDERDELLRNSKKDSPYNQSEKALDGRAPIRHPAFYQFVELGSRATFFLGVALGGHFSKKDIPNWRLNTLECEIRDLLDEMQRRVDKRPKVRSQNA